MCDSIAPMSVSALMPHIFNLTRTAVVSLSEDGVALVQPEKLEQMEQPEATAVSVKRCNKGQTIS